MKTAIVNIADTGALESTVHMLEAVGYECSRPDPELIRILRNADLEGVYSVQELSESWGYPEPIVSRLAKPADMDKADLFVDLKAHVNYPRIVKQWPSLANKVLWRCINGGDPTKRKDGLPWAEPPCPVLTDNQWYEGYLRAYTHFPPYQRLYSRYRAIYVTGPPICLVHNVLRWGYGDIVEPLQRLGVKFYGGNCPDGLLQYLVAMNQLSSSISMVHVKVGDSVGFATLEAMASACPILVSRFYIAETKLHKLFSHGATCITFDRPTAVEEVKSALHVLADPDYNTKLGLAGKNRLLEIMWNKDKPADLQSFKGFMEHYFPC